ncbi:MAG: hypothetical protein GX073_08100 [Firmicutes bacterium]|nr:hypothetical protein [Bacillota bacterium]
MVKRWLGSGKLIVRTPWPFGMKVHRIDLAIKDFMVRWERNSVLLTVEIERSIQYVTAADAVMAWTDRVVYQKDHPHPPALIRGQPLQAAANTLYFLVQDQKGTAVLEHGIGLSFSGWKRQPPVPVTAPREDSLLIRGLQLVAAGSCLHTETLAWSPCQPEDQPVTAVLTGGKFILAPTGIHFRGELQLASVKGECRQEPLSVLLPREGPADGVLVGEAKLQDLIAVAPGKALLPVKLDWRLFQEKTLPVLLAPGGQGESFLLWRLWHRETRIWSGQTEVKLPEKAKMITEVTVAAVQSRVVKAKKGLFCLGQITLDLYYVDNAGREKGHRVRLPWKDWLAAVAGGEARVAAGEQKYQIGVIRVKGEQIRLLNGEDLTLFLQLEYELTAGTRQKAVLVVPDPTVPTATILAEKIITEDAFEYYVEIPVPRPADFRESHRLWWQDGEVEGETGDGGVFLQARPTLIWQYRNTEHKLKAVDFHPVLAWFQLVPPVHQGDRVYVRLETVRLHMQAKGGENWGIQLLLHGRLTVTREELRAVALGGCREKGERLWRPAQKRTVLKWEEKLPCSVRQIITAHFFLGEFRRVKTEELLLLEGEVRGEITYLGKDGVSRYYRVRKELWANLPPEYNVVPVLIPVLSGWNCYPLTEWNWEKGGVWCEITVDLLAFTAVQINGKEVK